MSYLLRLFTFKITTVCGKYLHFTAGEKKRQNIKIGQIDKSFSFTQQKKHLCIAFVVISDDVSLSITQKMSPN